MKILLIRHAEPDYSIDSLTDKGWREAELLANRLCSMPIDDFYVSPLGRARDTSAATLDRLGREAEMLPWLQEYSGILPNPKDPEWSYAWDLMPQYWTRRPELFDRDRWLENALYGAGNCEQVYRETVQGLDALLERYGYRRTGMLYRTEKNSDATIALFCHFGIAMIMLSYLLGLSPVPLLHGFLMAPSSVTTLITEERTEGEVWFRCFGLGDVSHLYASDEPVSHSGLFHEQYGIDEGLGSK